MEFIKHFFGDLSLSVWTACSIYAIVGFIIYKTILFGRRSETFSKFSIKFWWRDNRYEFFIGSSFFWVLTRFHTDINGLLNANLGLPMINNIFLFNFLYGMLFQVLLKKLRKFFREPENALGKIRNSI